MSPGTAAVNAPLSPRPRPGPDRDCYRGGRYSTVGGREGRPGLDWLATRDGPIRATGARPWQQDTCRTTMHSRSVGCESHHEREEARGRGDHAMPWRIAWPDRNSVCRSTRREPMQGLRRSERSRATARHPETGRISDPFTSCGCPLESSARGRRGSSAHASSSYGFGHVVGRRPSEISRRPWRSRPTFVPCKNCKVRPIPCTVSLAMSQVPSKSFRPVVTVE